MSKTIITTVIVVLVIVFVLCFTSPFTTSCVAASCIQATCGVGKKSVHWKDPLVSMVTIPGRDSPDYHR